MDKVGEILYKKYNQKWFTYLDYKYIMDHDIDIKTGWAGTSFYLTIKEFCYENKIKEKDFFNWLKKEVKKIMEM